jgi:hypothetical protein
VIPKIIWQTHEWEYEDLPPNFKRSSQTWRNLNPTWEYRYHSAIDRAMTVREFDKTLYSYYLFADKVTQSDIWRYVVLYQHGGFYTDMDSICEMPLDYSFERYDGKDFFCSPVFIFETSDPESGSLKAIEWVYNSGIAAVKQSAVLKKLIDYIKRSYEEMQVLDIYNELEEMSEGGTRPNASVLWLGTITFKNIVLENRDMVCFKYSGSHHSKDIKESFDFDFVVDMYGSLKLYSELCKENNWI